MYLQVSYKKKYEKISELDPTPDPDPLVRGTDPQIRIHTRMSRIPNTEQKIYNSFQKLY
jgi:hypothetical protein